MKNETNNSKKINKMNSKKIKWKKNKKYTKKNKNTRKQKYRCLTKLNKMAYYALNT